MHWRRKWQPSPVFLPGESQGPWSLVGCHLWVAQSRTRQKRLSSSSSSKVWGCIQQDVEEHKRLKQAVSQHTAHNNTNEWNFKIKLDGYLKNYDSSSKREKGKEKFYNVIFTAFEKRILRLQCEDS